MKTFFIIFKNEYLIDDFLKLFLNSNNFLEILTKSMNMFLDVDFELSSFAHKRGSKLLFDLPSILIYQYYLDKRIFARCHYIFILFLGMKYYSMSISGFCLDEKDAW